MYRHSMTSLNEAAIRGHTASVELLIRAGSYVNTTDKYGWAPLSWACRNSTAENNYSENKTIRMLIDAGADVNYYLPESGECNEPPIIMASERGNDECVQILIDAGADVNIGMDGSEDTEAEAMSMAKKGGHTAIEVMLREAGAKG